MSSSSSVSTLLKDNGPWLVAGAAVALLFRERSSRKKLQRTTEAGSLNQGDSRARNASVSARRKDLLVQPRKTYRSWAMHVAPEVRGTSGDVANWLVALNPEFKQYVPAFKQLGINAPVLFSLDHATLQQELGVASKLHRNTILMFAKGNAQNLVSQGDAKSFMSSDADSVSLPLRGGDTADEDTVSLNLQSLSSKQSLEDVDVSGKRLLMRVDYNVPMDEDQEITDTHRIDATLPSLRYILAESKKAKAAGKPGFKSLALIAHLGRPPVPGGKFERSEYSLKPCVAILEAKLGVKVQFLDDCVGPAVEQALAECKEETIFLLENLRLHVEETGKGVGANKEKVVASKASVAQFSAQLSALGDVYIFEAFGAAHRPHASVVNIDCKQKVAGLLMKLELDTWAGVMGKPQKPVLAIVGGAKVSDKILVLENLLSFVDELVIGGGMAYTFKKVLDGVDIGDSLFDAEGAKLVQSIADKCKANNVVLHLPTDHVIGHGFSEDAEFGVTSDAAGIPSGWLGLDIGPETRVKNAAIIKRANTIIWNGPMGKFEWGAYAGGTLDCMCQVVEATKRGAKCVIGGGDTGRAASEFFYENKTVAEQITHVSTGGGSSLVLMEGKMLPAVPPLSEKN